MAKRVVPGSLTTNYTNRADDFSPNLVGQQFTDGNAFFTLGNFSLTTNTTQTTGEFFNTGEFSEKFNLDNLELTTEQSLEVATATSNRLNIRLKFNKNNLNSYVYFSDASKFVESEIIDIVLKWKGSLYSRYSYINDTITDFSYDEFKDISYFKISINVLENNYQLITDDIPGLNTISTNEISFIPSNYTKYEISNSYGKFPILEYTGNTSTDVYLKVKTKGLAWPSLNSGSTTSGSFEYHLKPNDVVLNDVFFNTLSPFQSQLMSTDTIPDYTLKLRKSSPNSIGTQNFNITETFTWPVSDGYNIDIQGRGYAEFLTSLLKFAESYDDSITNIMVRRLVSDSIFEFDTASDGTDPNTGRKMDKLMKIWGREYDKIKTYIDGISFANVITYDENENTSDELIKTMARTLGFDTLQSFSSNELVKFFQKTTQGVFEPQSTGVSLAEMDLELWRRLVINAWWLFKSKGTRKVIEFFLSLFNIDECLVDLDEIVYLAEDKLDYTAITQQIRDYYGFLPDESTLPFDTDGYPKILRNSPEYYFQLNGFWYDGGVDESGKPDTNGNNPHFGPYDFGRAYFEKFTCLLNNFVPANEVVNLNLLQFNYFTDYSLGTIEGVGEILVQADNQDVNTTLTGDQLIEYGTFYAGVMNTTNRVDNALVNFAGADTETSNTGLGSFHINFFNGDEDECVTEFCPENISLTADGLVTYTEEIGESGENQTQILMLEFCCKDLGFDNYYQNINNGETPCYWCPPIEVSITTTNSVGDEVLDGFTNPNGDFVSVGQPCCVARGGAWTTPVGPDGSAGKPFCKIGPVGPPVIDEEDTQTG
tara:strand:- start:4642 stop:7110 length:2469 start_codon:yes stop_codon:yes gene_type:complete